MQRYFSVLLILMLGACATPAVDSGGRNDVAFYALSLVDTAYRYGGNSVGSGFDCSGFVQHVYRNTLGIRLPRTSSEISQVGEHAVQLRPGDLVFFNTKQQPFSHVGIYLGDNRFVHSPSSGKAITVSNMLDHYWSSRYNGARRIAAD